MRRKLLSKFNHCVTVRRMVWVGLVLLTAVTAFAGHRELKSTQALAEETLAALKQQCVSYNKLTASDRTKSLFWLSDLMLDFRSHLAREPEMKNDASLENYVNNVRLTGVALLDGDLRLEASGYTRQYRENWSKSYQHSQLADILRSPQKIYTQRMFVDGEYFDICAMARLDAPGVLVGFYQQPTGLISNTETDLESLLSGLQLERGGHYIIAEDDSVRVTSEIIGPAQTDESLLASLSRIPKDGKLHFLFGNGHHLWGVHSGCQQYSLYVYYPLGNLLTAYLTAAAVFSALYCILCLMYYATRNQTLYENQEQLRRSNQSLLQTVQMLKALETIYFSLFYVDAVDGTYRTVYVAPWLKKQIPEAGDYQTLKKLFLDRMIVPDYRENIDRQLDIPYVREMLHQKNLTDVRTSFYVDYQAVRGSKAPWCRVTATPVDFDEAGNPLHFLALIQDIDKEKVKEADYQAQILKEAQEAKVANNAKTEFLRRISHDIRTPINGIQGYIRLGAEHPEDFALQAHCRDRAAIALKNLTELVSSVLDMSKLESGQIIKEEKPFDLTELLDNANVVLIPQAQAKHVAYEVLRQEPVPVTHLIGSPQLLSQLILNITSNAVKYTPAGGRVQVNTCLVSQTPDTATYRFVCADNGVGMSEDFQKHMYEPFSQEAVDARTRYEGTGLGLSIVKKLVDVLGGTIICQSQKGVGTTFTVQLTFSIDTQYQQPSAAPAPAQEKPLLGKRVLLVEDNELNMEIAEYLFSQQGALVTKAWNGLEAVNAFAASEPQSIDLIVMDVMMPQMGGREATRTIRSLNRPDAKTVPIIAMSANSFADDIQKNMASGMNAHVSKPVDSSKLMAALARLFPGSPPKNSCA